jgi:Spy/CpxP family protein refolding chaperone
MTTASGDGTSSAAVSTPGATRIAAVAPSIKSSHIRVIANALSTVALRDDQRAEIESLASDADTRHAAIASAHGEIMSALATQIEAGKIDRPALQAKVDAATAAGSAAHTADDAALQRLHALLTPEQRGQVADALVAQHDAMHAEHKHGSHKDRMEQWATDLKLSDAQKTQIGALLAAQREAHHAEFKATHEGMHEHGTPGSHPFADAFRADTLVLPAPPDGAHGHPRGGMAEHVIGIAETILPLLTPEQRGLAAAKLREHAAGGNEEGPLGE